MRTFYCSSYPELQLRAGNNVARFHDGFCETDDPDLIEAIENAAAELDITDSPNPSPVSPETPAPATEEEVREQLAQRTVDELYELRDLVDDALEQKTGKRPGSEPEDPGRDGDETGSPAGGGEPPEQTLPYEAMDHEALKAEVAERGLQVEGSGQSGKVVKRDLVAALKADDEAKAAAEDE